MSASDYLEGQIRNHMLRTASWTKPTQWWIGLIITLPDETGAGLVEVVGGAYQRVQRNPGDANWTAAGYNVASLTFAAPTANWGYINGVGLWDLSVGGTLQVFDPIDNAPFYVAAGDPEIVFLPGKLQLFFD